MKKRHWLLVAIGCLLLLAAGVSAAFFMSHRRDVTTSSEAAYDSFKEGLANEQRMYSKEARLAFAKALELDPTFAMAMLGLSRHSKDEDQRSALVRRAAKEKDRLTERERLHVEQALAYEEKRYDEALKIASEIHQKFPADTRSATMLAYQEISKGNTDHAIKIFEELLTIDPNNAEAYNQIGYFYGYPRRLRQGRRGLQALPVHRGRQGQPLRLPRGGPGLLGPLQRGDREPEPGARDSSPTSWIRSRTSPSSTRDVGEYRKAIETYERAVEITDDPKRQRDYFGRAARAAFYLDDRDEMRRLFARCRAVKLEGKHAEIDDAFLDAALALVDGHAAQAEKMVRAVQPKLDALLAQENLPKDWKPHFPQLNFMLALTLEEQGKADEALEYWKKNANPPRPFDNFEERRMIYEARAKVAVALAKKGDLDRAEKLIAENRKWNPSWAPTRPEETTVAELRREKVLAASK